MSLSTLRFQSKFRYITRDEHDDLEQQKELLYIEDIETHYVRRLWNWRDTILDAFRKIAEITKFNGRAF